MSDTTKVNMGRRQTPKCQGMFCNRRVDTVGDDFCRVCKGVRPPARKRHYVKRAG